MRRQSLSRVLFLNEVYQKIVNVHGVVMEFGTLWGTNLALFQNLRGVYEPFNHSRKIIGFDTFEGFSSIAPKDGSSKEIKPKNYSTPKGYDNYLEKILAYHETQSPIQHIRKFELVKGDALLTLPTYFKKNPETVIALAFFDMDLYKPTKACLEKILPRMPKGAVIVFDELSLHAFPGETLAVMDVLGIHTCRLQRTPYSSVSSYMVIE